MLPAMPVSVKGSEKLVISRAYPSYFRLVLRSIDRDSGSSKGHASFSHINLPEGFGSAPAVLMVESCVFAQATTLFNDYGAINMHIPQIIQQRSFTTAYDSPSDHVATVCAPGTLQNSCTVDSLGIQLPSSDLFRHGRLSVYLSTPAGHTGAPRKAADLPLDLSSWSGEWQLILAIVALDKTVGEPSSK